MTAQPGRPAARQGGAALCWLDRLAGWGGTAPAALIRHGPVQRHRLLAELAAAVLGIAAEAVVIESGPAGPRLVYPEAGLFLSSARRGPFTALAVAWAPIGVDVELVEPEAAIPWNVLHRQEAALLAGLRGPARARAFARLWTLKEAYVKALGTGFRREPASFAIRFLDDRRASVDDPLRHGTPPIGHTVWRRAEPGANEAAASALWLA